jgi:glutamate synthase (ferredoxin)
VGIATQRPELREKFEGTPEQVMAYLEYVAEETRRLLASLGLRTLDEAIGRTDVLRPVETGDPRADSLDLRPLLEAAGDGPRRFVGDVHIEPGGWELGDRLAQDAAPALERAGDLELSYSIENRDRTVGARLGGRIGKRFGAGDPPGRVVASFDGVAGQGFGAFLAAGVELRLTGETNDYVGKGMGGGRIVVRPPADDAGEPVLLGNTVLYGATGGELYCAGGAGERFAVRNSGAIAVVEGTGDHPCEYMTGGTVVVLGPYGLNVGAGMTGGQAYVWDPAERMERHLNPQLVAATRLEGADAATLRELLEQHVAHTGSTRAAELLERFSEAVTQFWRVAPKAEVARIESDAEGTTAQAPARSDAAAGRAAGGPAKAGAREDASLFDRKT